VARIPGFDSAAPLSPALLAAADRTLRQPARVRAEYLDSFSQGRAGVELAHQHGLAVLLVANSTTIRLVRGDYTEGLAYGHAQAALARDLGAPPGTGIVVDIEAVFQPTPEWLAGVVYAWLVEGCEPLVYCSLRQPASVNTLLAAHMHYPAMRHVTIWSATPCLQSGGAWDRGLPEWQANHIPGYATVGWQFAEGVDTGDGAVDLDLWDGAMRGLWLPERPMTPPAPDVQEAIVALRALQRQADVALAALSR